MAKQVDRVATKATPVEALAAISEAHERVFGERPEQHALLVLAGQSALETGRWQHFYNWNPGGVKASPQGAHDYATYLTTEVLDGKTVKLEQHFRAYPTLADGMVDWLRVLGGRYAPALAKLLTFDPEGYVAELKRLRYFTADEASYAKNVRALALEFGRLPIARPPLVRPETYGEALVQRIVGAAIDTTGERGGDGGADG